MLNRCKATPDRMAHIRAYLDKKTKPELVALLLELVQEMDEPTRQHFWEYLAPPGMATADLRYPSAEDFLAELETFAEEVAEGEYSNEEAATYYGEDNYNDYDDYDPDDHAGVKALRTFFHEADSYFGAGQFAVAAEAYGNLLDLVFGETYETLGLPTPLEFLSQDERQVVSRYFAALQASLPQDEFFDQALRFLALSQIVLVLEMRLVVVDDRAEFLTAERFPQAMQRIHVQYDRGTEHLEPMPVNQTPSTYIVVATWGWDEPALAQILNASPAPAYVGLIASKTKWRVIREMLLVQGIPAESLDRVHAPAGLDLGAETPGEIALSILAEMLAVREKATMLPMSTSRK